MPFSILYAEDELTIRDLVAARLSRRYPDVRLDTADNGASGLALFMRSHYDLIITDNSMPHMTGLQMVSEIRTINPGMPVIFVTASLIQSGFINVSTENKVHLLQKPFRFSELFGLIDSYNPPSGF